MGRTDNDILTPSTPAVPNCCRSVRSAPSWSNPPFLIFYIQALWRSGLSARVPECQKIKNGGLDQYGKCKALTASAVKGLHFVVETQEHQLGTIGSHQMTTVAEYSLDRV